MSFNEPKNVHNVFSFENDVQAFLCFKADYLSVLIIWYLSEFPLHAHLCSIFLFLFFCFFFFMYIFQHCFICTVPRIPLCRRMLGSIPCCDFGIDSRTLYNHSARSHPCFTGCQFIDNICTYVYLKNENNKLFSLFLSLYLRTMPSISLRKIYLLPSLQNRNGNSVPDLMLEMKKEK